MYIYIYVIYIYIERERHVYIYIYILDCNTPVGYGKIVSASWQGAATPRRRPVYICMYIYIYIYI